MHGTKEHAGAIPVLRLMGEMALERGDALLGRFQSIAGAPHAQWVRRKEWKSDKNFQFDIAVNSRTTADLGFNSRDASQHAYHTCAHSPNSRPTSVHALPSDLGLHCREACQAQNTSDCRACAHSLPLLGRPHVHLQAERPRGTIPRVQCTCVLLHALQHGLPILGTPCVHVSVEKHRSSIP